MTPDDLAQLHAAAFEFPRPWSAAEFASLLDGAGTFLVTEPGGFALGRAIAGEAELLTIAVDPGARRQGLGARLMQTFESEARTRGAETAFLEVAATNAPAIALYHRAGFAETGRRRGYYRLPDGKPVDACLFSKQIGQSDGTSP
ncbi:MAG: ribosomal protein S18-alanine N-acetyltransferase [Rhodobacteraceae bacterium]|nr:ribosomal protein S18-alanine N-acetyltransferase [Paracoccaceae bacterium]